MKGLGWGGVGWLQKGDTTAARSANHVLVPLVQPHLAEGPAAHHHVDGRGDEAVIGDLLVQGVHLLGRGFVVIEITFTEWDVLNENGRVDVKENSQQDQHNDPPDTEDDPAGGQLGPAAQKRSHCTDRSHRAQGLH